MQKYLTAILLAGSVTLTSQQRDRGAVSQPAGSSSLSGVVVSDAAAPAPVRGAVVTLAGAELPDNRATMADVNGRFRFEGLPAGRFTVSVSKPPFITTAHGAKRPGGPGTPITLAVGQQVTDVTIRLKRGAVITGMLRDRQGEAVPAASVAALRVDLASGGVAPVAQTTQTDDRGVYRFFGLMPGKYVVVTPRPISSGEMSRPLPADVDAALAELQNRGGRSGFPPPTSARPPGESTSRKWPTVGIAPIFYPGTASASEVTAISVSAGEERTGVDFAIGFVPTATIEGTIAHPEGSPASVLLVITPADSLLSLFAILTPTLSQPPDAEGKFRYTNVAPGTYTIAARSSAGAPARPPGGVGVGGGSGGGSGAPPAATPGRALWAMADVTVTGDDVAGVTLALQPSMRLGGRIAFDPATLEPQVDLTQLAVRLTSTRSRGSGVLNGTNLGTLPIPPAQVRADGSFEVGGVMPGSYRASVTGIATDWWLRSAVVSGRDTLDEPLVFGRSGDVSGAILTLTDRHSELSGTLQTPTGSAATDYFVVVFPAARDLWRPQSRRIRSARPADDGRFAFRDLPAGDYLTAALADLDPSDLDDPAFLEQIVGAAVKVSLGEGQQKTQNLRIGG